MTQKYGFMDLKILLIHKSEKLYVDTCRKTLLWTDYFTKVKELFFNYDYITCNFLPLPNHITCHALAGRHELHATSTTHAMLLNQDSFLLANCMHGAKDHVWHS